MTTNEKFTTELKKKLLHEFMEDIGAKNVSLIEFSLLKLYIKSDPHNREAIEQLFPELGELEELRWILIGQMAKGPKTSYPLVHGDITYDVTITARKS